MELVLGKLYVVDKLDETTGKKLDLKATCLAVLREDYNIGFSPSELKEWDDMAEHEWRVYFLEIGGCDGYVLADHYLYKIHDSKDLDYKNFAMVTEDMRFVVQWDDGATSKESVLTKIINRISKGNYNIIIK